MRLMALTAVAVGAVLAVSVAEAQRGGGNGGGGGRGGGWQGGGSGWQGGGGGWQGGGNWSGSRPGGWQGGGGGWQGGGNWSGSRPGGWQGGGSGWHGPAWGSKPGWNGGWHGAAWGGRPGWNSGWHGGWGRPGWGPPRGGWVGPGWWGAPGWWGPPRAWWGPPRGVWGSPWWGSPGASVWWGTPWWGFSIGFPAFAWGSPVAVQAWPGAFPSSQTIYVNPTPMPSFGSPSGMPAAPADAPAPSGTFCPSGMTYDADARSCAPVSVPGEPTSRASTPTQRVRAPAPAATPYGGDASGDVDTRAAGVMRVAAPRLSPPPQLGGRPAATQLAAH